MGTDKNLFDLFAQKETEEGRIYSVSELTGEIKKLLVSNFGTENFWIKGEISNYRGRNSQGHIYFRLKDEKAVINAAFFKYANSRLSFDLEEGMQVMALGKVGLYEPHGSYQFVIESIKPAGAGELFLRFEKLKKKLADMGLFDEGRKRPLPAIPERIAIITSPTGAALKDMTRIIGNRLPSTDIIIFPVRVQGQEAKKEIARALKLANLKKFQIDVIILGRGGGSIEELWAFNEEIVAYAIAKSRVPVVSAVGHETDYTISDFVADIRAATPSNAAELVVPDRRELARRIDSYIQDIVSSLRQRINLCFEKIRGFQRSPVLRDPMVLLRDRQQTLDNLIDRATAALKLRIERDKSRFSSFAADFAGALKHSLKSREARLSSLLSALKALNPVSVLERGYSIARDSFGRIVKSYRGVKIGDDIMLTLSEGFLDLKVEKASKDEKD